MPARGSLKAVSDEPQSLFGSKTITIGDTEYTVNELEGGVYDECIDLAKTETGVDTNLLLKFMTERSVTPKMSLAEINKLPFTKRGELFDTVNAVHFPSRPVGKAEGA
jgi:hypothetical protein